jgi:hypothetical protein
VTDAATEKPIAQVRVTYRSRTISTDGKYIEPPEQRGEVSTADDGRFTLPLLPRGGGYEVRVSAPGYISAGQNLNEHVQGLRELPPPKPPANWCMAHYGKPDCVLPVPDGNFLLIPSAVELQQMSEAAQGGFGLPKENLLQMPPMRAAALSANGNRVALLTVLPHMTVEQMADPAVCVGWIYDFSADRLSRIEPQLPAKYCEGATTSLNWDGDTVLLRFDETIYGAQKIETSRETMRWLGDAAQPASVERLPGLMDQKALDNTEDQRFVADSVSEDCPQCMNALLGSFGAIPDYWLDRAKNRLILIAADEQGEKQIGVQIVDMSSHESKFYPLPTFRGRPALVAARFLDDGRARVAYTMEGACDPFSPDAPYDLPSYQGGPTHRLSLCLATLPAAGKDSAQQTGR